MVDSVQLSTTAYSGLSIEQLEKLIKLYESYKQDKRERSTLIEHNNQQVLSYYTGESRELTLANLIDVIEEVGLNNQLFVLAQAVLETGHFTSSVCKNYHNLFGLYDSKHKDYYRFARWEDSVVGYRKFIQYRYKGGNYLQFLKRIGYAEDPRYTTTVAKIATQLYKRLSTQ
ncbi:glucosaminidase domain-containing protein [Prevotella dentalis]|nr:glucosaminidase domain-containing protein [Prevotella dentalis]